MLPFAAALGSAALVFRLLWLFFLIDDPHGHRVGNRLRHGVVLQADLEHDRVADFEFVFDRIEIEGEATVVELRADAEAVINVLVDQQTPPVVGALQITVLGIGAGNDRPRPVDREAKIRSASPCPRI